MGGGNVHIRRLKISNNCQINIVIGLMIQCQQNRIMYLRSFTENIEKSNMMPEINSNIKNESKNPTDGGLMIGALNLKLNITNKSEGKKDMWEVSNFLLSKGTKINLRSY